MRRDTSVVKHQDCDDTDPVTLDPRKFRETFGSLNQSPIFNEIRRKTKKNYTLLYFEIYT